MSDQADQPSDDRVKLWTIKGISAEAIIGRGKSAGPSAEIFLLSYTRFSAF